MLSEDEGSKVEDSILSSAWQDAIICTLGGAFLNPTRTDAFGGMKYFTLHQVPAEDFCCSISRLYLSFTAVRLKISV